MTGTPVKVLIVDDLPAARAILTDAVDAAIPAAQTFTAGSVAEADTVLAGIGVPDLALVDLGLPDGHGTTLIRRLKADGVITAAATIMEDDRSIDAVLAAGADGYLLKDVELPLLAARIERLLSGEPVLSTAIARRVLTRFMPAADETPDSLSAREREILSLVARGMRVPEVATILKISRHTVRDHIKSIYRKLEVSSRAEAAVEAHRRNLT